MPLRKFFFVASVVLFCASPIATSSLRGQPAQGDLKFTISLARRAYKPNEPIVLQMKLENTSNHPIVVNSRFLVNIAGGPHEVVLQIIASDKTTVPFDTLIRASFQSERYVNLPPGQAVTHAYNIVQDFLLNQPGEYSIRAYYENERDAPSSMKLSPAWTGTLESNKVQFTIR